MRLIGKGLHHANPAHGIFHPRIELAQVIKHFAVGVGHLLVKVDRDPAHQRHNQKGQHRQLPVDPRHQTKGADQRHDGNKDILGTMMGHLADHVQIAGDAGDEMAGLLVVKKAERQLLDMIKKLAPHVGLNVDTEHVTPIGDNILQRRI